MTREQKVKRLAQDLVDSFEGCQYTPEEVDCEEEGATEVRSEVVFGTSQGPAAGIILAEQLGFRGPDAEEAGQEYCDTLAEEVGARLSRRFPGAINAHACWEDNCLFAQVVYG